MELAKITTSITNNSIIIERVIITYILYIVLIIQILTLYNTKCTPVIVLIQDKSLVFLVHQINTHHER